MLRLSLNCSVSATPTGFRGDVETTALYAGQSCGLVNDLLPAADIVAQVAQQAEAILRGLNPAG